MPKLLKKFAPGQKRTLNVKFKPATDVEMKALGDNIPDGYIAGWASTQDMDVYQHIVMDGAFTKSIQKRGLTGPKGIKLLLGHNWDQMAGVIKRLEYRPGGLWIEAQMNLAISYVRDAYEAAKANEGISFSVGFILVAYTVKGDDKQGEWLQIDEGDLYEVSIVPFPANDSAGMVFIKDASESDINCVADFEKYLVAKGLCETRAAANKITQVVKSYPKLFFKAAVTPVVTPPVIAPTLLSVERLDAAVELMARLKATLAP
jgi:HK97 family phage prohead protease